MKEKLLGGRYLLLLAVVFSMAAALLFYRDYTHDLSQLDDTLLNRARAHFRDILLTRKWNADYGGVYVEKRPGVATNHYQPDSDIKATNGKTYVLRNPALMSREISLLIEKEGLYRSKTTGLKLINPDNAPDAWEEKALNLFSKRERKEVFEKITVDDKTLFRYMAPLVMEQACMNCHQHLGFKVGDIRGGISITFDISDQLLSERRHTISNGKVYAGSVVILWIISLIILGRYNRSWRRETQRYQDLLQSQDGIVWEADAHTFNFTFISQKAERLLGYPLDDWMTPGFWVAHLHPDDRDWAPDYCASCTRRAEPHDFEYRFITKDGRTIWLQDIVSVHTENGHPTTISGLMIDITARKAAALQMEQLLNEKNIILDNALVGIVFLRNRVITSCNRRFEEMFGYDPGELIGKSTEVLYASRELFLQVGDRAYDALSINNNSYTEELLLRNKHGGIFWGAINGRAINPETPMEGTIWIYADITERKTAEEENHKLVEHRRFFEVLTENAPAPVYAIRVAPDYPVAYANQATAQHFGYDLATLLTQHLRDWDPEFADHHIDTLIDDLKQGGSKTFETSQILSDGRSIPVEVFARYIEFDGQAYVTGFFRDITERIARARELQESQMLLEQIVRRRTEQLTEALSVARQAEKAKDEFLANMSHEIRTPLNAILGLCGLALKQRSESKRDEYLEKINDAGETLLATLNDLLDLSKIAAGHLPLENRPFHLGRELDSVLTMLGHKASAKSLGLILSIADDIPDTLRGDALRLRQILLNLLSNAIKFTPRGRISVDVTLARQEGDQVSILMSVSDEGIGLSAEEISRIFTPFTQADSSITRKFGGTGLGLAICKRLCTMMGGDIQVSSTPGKGSTFSASMTFDCVQAEVEGQNDLNDDTPSLPTHYLNTRVLVVDDHPINLTIAGELLKELGITCDYAETGQAAIDLIFSKPTAHYDVVLMDIQMPVMDGLMAVKEIRRHKAFATLPVIAMTAHAMTHEQERSRKAGMSDHLGKPFKPVELHRLLAHWIDADKQVVTPPPAPANITNALAVDLPGFEVTGALARFSGNHEKYCHWLTRFLAESAVFESEMTQALEAGKLDAAHTIAHGLKGKSGALGITRVHLAAQKLTELLQNADDWHDAWEEMRNELSTACATLEPYLARQCRNDEKVT